MTHWIDESLLYIYIYVCDRRVSFRHFVIMYLYVYMYIRVCVSVYHSRHLRSFIILICSSLDSAYASGNIWSYETTVGCGSPCQGGGYHDFVINTCCGIVCMRWGFLQNNEYSCASNDVVNGIGIGGTSFAGQASCGDYYSTYGEKGFNGTMYASIWGRRT